MTTVALASARHSPGVTTTVLALAAAWPAHRRLLVIEADPAGGELISRYALMAEPNLLTLAAQARSTVTAERLWANTQRLPGDLATVVAPIDPAQASAALAALMRAGLAQALAADHDVDVLVDLGRLGPDSPAAELFASADVAAMVARSTLTQAAHLQQRIAWFDREVELVVIGSDRWKPEELAAGVGAARVLSTLPDDPAGAAALHAPGRGGKALRRSALWHPVGRLAEALAASALPTAPPPSPAGPSPIGVR